jgi:hypothetical protein
MYGTQKQLILAQPEDYLLIVILDNFVEAWEGKGVYYKDYWKQQNIFWKKLKELY